MASWLTEFVKLRRDNEHSGKLPVFHLPGTGKTAGEIIYGRKKNPVQTPLPRNGTEGAAGGGQGTNGPDGDNDNDDHGKNPSPRDLDLWKTKEKDSIENRDSGGGGQNRRRADC